MRMQKRNTKKTGLGVSGQINRIPERALLVRVKELTVFNSSTNTWVPILDYVTVALNAIYASPRK